MKQLEIEIKKIFENNMITASKDDDYNKWDLQIITLGKKIGTLRRNQRKEIIIGFIKQTILWHKLKINNEGISLLTEKFIGKGYDNRAITEGIAREVSISDDNDNSDYDKLYEQYNEILTKRISNFEQNFYEISKKYQV